MLGTRSIEYAHAHYLSPAQRVCLDDGAKTSLLSSAVKVFARSVVNGRGREALEVGGRFGSSPSMRVCACVCELLKLVEATELEDQERDDERREHALWQAAADVAGFAVACTQCCMAVPGRRELT